MHTEALVFDTQVTALQHQPGSGAAGHHTQPQHQKHQPGPGRWQTPRPVCRARPGAAPPSGQPMAGAMLTVGIKADRGSGSVGCAPKPRTGEAGDAENVSAQATNATVNAAAIGRARCIRFSSHGVRQRSFRWFRRRRQDDDRSTVTRFARCARFALVTRVSRGALPTCGTLPARGASDTCSTRGTCGTGGTRRTSGARHGDWNRGWHGNHRGAVTGHQAQAGKHGGNQKSVVHGSSLQNCSVGAKRLRDSSLANIEATHDRRCGLSASLTLFAPFRSLAPKGPASARG